MRRQQRRSLVVIGAATLILSMTAACGGGDDGAEPDASGEIRIELDEFSFSPGTIRVKAGDTVTFVLDNVGDKEHEFMIGRNVDSDEGFPNGFHTNFFDGLSPTVVPMDAAMGMDDMAMDDDMTGTTMAMDDDAAMDDDMDMDDGDAHGEDHGFMIMRDPTQSATVTITIPANAVGEWEIACFEEDGAHYDDGMKGKLIVDA